MKGKIIQIIPAPNNLFAVYKIDGENKGFSVLCIALTDQSEVLLMNVDASGFVGEASETSSFSHFKWK